MTYGNSASRVGYDQQLPDDYDEGYLPPRRDQAACLEPARPVLGPIIAPLFMFGLGVVIVTVFIVAVVLALAFACVAPNGSRAGMRRSPLGIGRLAE